MAVKDFKKCQDFSRLYVNLTDSQAHDYLQVRVVFDDYTKETSLKEGTRERRRGKSKVIRSYIIENTTVIRDKGTFLSSNSTKDSLCTWLNNSSTRVLLIILWPWHAVVSWQTPIALYQVINKCKNTGGLCMLWKSLRQESESISAPKTLMSCYYLFAGCHC